jgi:uncharacterized protein (DUF1800 family)
MPTSALPQVTPPRLDTALPARPRAPRPDLRRLIEARGGAPLGDLRGLRLSLSARARLAGLGFGPPRAPERAPHRDPVLTLVHRATQGFEWNEYQRARSLGYEAYLAEQLAPEAIDDAALDARLAGYTTLLMSPKELFETYSADFSEPYLQFKGAVLLRSLYSRRQLFERTVEFWNDHFSIDHDKGDIEWLFLPDNERLKIRPNAFGSFPTLLSASAHSNAMLFYLDNWLNVAGAPQENYARELLELHTLGVQGGYNEVDVKEVAKCFTGWTLNPDFASPNWFRQFFDVDLHTGGQKLVLGNVIPVSPPRDNAQRVLDIVATHPSTAQFVGRKLARWFLTPTPPPALVDQVAAEFLATGGDVKALLGVLLARENLRWTSPVVRPKLRRPFHLVATLLRALGAEVEDPLFPLFYLLTMGHFPFGHVQPDGFPDTTEAWGRSLLPRWRFAAGLLRPLAIFGQPFPGVHLAFADVAARIDYAGPDDRVGLAARIDERLFGKALSALELEVLQDFIDAQAPLTQPDLYDAIALGASLPGFQWY